MVHCLAASSYTEPLTPGGISFFPYVLHTLAAVNTYENRHKDNHNADDAKRRNVMIVHDTRQKNRDALHSNPKNYDIIETKINLDQNHSANLTCRIVMIIVKPTAPNFDIV